VKKKCDRCNETKPLEAFAEKSSAPDGKQPWCRKCFTVYNSENRAHNQARSRSRVQQIRTEFLQEYGGQCVCCGEAEPAFLGLDHTNGTGGEERKKLNRRGYTLLFKLKERGWPKQEYRILCHNCNLGRQITGVCPHQLKVGVQTGTVNFK